MTERLRAASRPYFDTNIFVYLVEGSARFRADAAGAFTAALEAGTIITSELTVAECLYGAFKKSDGRLAGRYRALFKSGSGLIMCPVDQAILDRAAQSGPRLGLKLLDAIHVATAHYAECDAFLTNDRGIRKALGLNVIHLTPPEARLP